MTRRGSFVLALGLGLGLMLLTLASLGTLPAVAEWSTAPAAAPGMLAIPTPITRTADVGPDWIVFTLINTDTITTTQTSNGFNLPSYPVADIEWTLGFTDQQTVTCKLQFSNDNTNWADGVNIVAAATADVTNVDQFNLFGRYTRVVCTPVGTNAYTVTVNAKVHR